jgi:hypothetical protein
MSGGDSNFSIEAALNRIAKEERQPTAWEGECLFVALITAAMGDHKLARHFVELAEAKIPAADELMPTRFSVEVLRDLLSQLED